MSRTMRFGGLTIRYDDGVLEPRPWTVLQSEWVASLVDTGDAFLELGCGVGHIGLEAVRLSGARAVLVDADAHACELAERNAARARLDARVEIRCAKFADALAASERYGVITADPPYVPSHEAEHLDDDPDHAVDGGDDGLDEMRAVVEVAAQHLLPAGSLVLQTLGEQQARAVERLCQADLGIDLRLVEVRAVDERRAVALFTASAPTAPSAA